MCMEWMPTPEELVELQTPVFSVRFGRWTLEVLWLPPGDAGGKFHASVILDGDAENPAEEMSTRSADGLLRWVVKQMWQMRQRG